MDLSAIEDDLVSKLTTDIPTIKTIGFPNDVSEFIDKHPKGGILVRYDGSTYIEPEPNSQKKVLQDRTSTWTFSIISKSLKREKQYYGIYDTLEAIRASLTGYTITGLDDATVMFPGADGFVSNNAAHWAYEITFSFDYPEAEL